MACNIFLHKVFYKQNDSERIDTLSICSPLYPKLAWFRRLRQGWHNLFKPSVLFMKHKQAVQTKIRVCNNGVSLVGLWWRDFPGGGGGRRIRIPCPPSGPVHKRPYIKQESRSLHNKTKRVISPSQHPKNWPSSARHVIHSGPTWVAVSGVCEH